MVKAIPYLMFDNTVEAIKYYEDIFGDILVERTALSPEIAEKMGIEGDPEQMTMHAVINVGGSLIMCSDNMKQMELSGRAILLDFDVNKEEDVRKIKEFAENAQNNEQTNVTMPLMEQPWGGMMGQFIDKYGIFWMLHAQDFSKQAEKGVFLSNHYNN